LSFRRLRDDGRGGRPYSLEVTVALNPYDPLKRTDLSRRERALLQFTAQVVHGSNLSLIDTLVAPDYMQHTHGVGQGREGIRKYVTEISARRPGREQWRPLLIFEDGDFVILYKLLPAFMIVDIVRFNANDQLAEHWDIVQPLPSRDCDPMELSKEDVQRFYSLFGITRER
jgi:predicted SnoaL-like aldol condensation-catalyzing enzyme